MSMSVTLVVVFRYSKTCLKQPLKRLPKTRIVRPIIAKCMPKVLQNVAVLLSCIKLPHYFKTFVFLSIFEWPLKTGIIFLR